MMDLIVFLFAHQDINIDKVAVYVYNKGGEMYSI
jgi:hypothetical protein